MSHRVVVVWLLASVALLILAVWQQDSLPDARMLLPELQQEPVQEAVNKPAFEQTVSGINYRIQPLYEYELHGLVVSRHDAGSWRDYLHARWNDNLNVADLCVVWGRNVDTDIYTHVTDDIAFSSGQFTCNYFTRSREAWVRFNKAAISNNHLLTADDDMAALIRSARIGDQVRLRGYLAEYSHNDGGGFHRGTSTVRTDTGNGACETVYVNSFEVLQPAGGGWRMLAWLAAGSLLLGLLAWFRSPLRVR